MPDMMFEPGDVLILRITGGEDLILYPEYVDGVKVYATDRLGWEHFPGWEWFSPKSPQPSRK